ncbi:MAG: hypothetical protein PHF67_00410 [Candidatus Nanoarchaeia archaeon]|nr:hypothetical protein [Candidatus Nanoarchaeia archaeon]
MKKGILYVTGELDVLPYYSKVSPALAGFLKNKPLASKVHLEKLFFLNRGSNKKPIFIADFSSIDSKMLSLRKNHLKDVKNRLNEKQILIWEYFVPRKFVQFFYATNGERVGKPIERIFIDIDRKKHSPEEAGIVALNLINLIKKDRDFNQKIRIKKTIVLWTGGSFHIIILLNKRINLNFYNKYLSYGMRKEKSFITKWAEEITNETNIPVSAGHEKSEKFIILDSSNTPSGKLARTPFSLHIKDWQTYDGLCVPVSIEDLNKKDTVKKLQKLTPEKVLKNLEKYKRLL